MRRTGFSLIELLIVIVILGIVAKVAIPMFSSDETKLEIAASEVANALRFARSEAQRTGKIYQFSMTTGATPQLRLYSLNSSFSEDTGNPTYHPVDKNAYTFLLKDKPYGSGITVTGQPAAGPFLATKVNFCPQNAPFPCVCGEGAPVHIVIVPFVGAVANCYDANKNFFTLQLNNKARNVFFDPLTGRVTMSLY